MTILDLLKDAEFNLKEKINLKESISNINFAKILLEKGYCIYDDIDFLLDKIILLKNIPPKDSFLVDCDKAYCPDCFGEGEIIRRSGYFDDAGEFYKEKEAICQCGKKFIHTRKSFSFKGKKKPENESVKN